jgi:hypothetical protein
MVDYSKTTHEVRRRFEADANQLVPVTDEIGGTVIYLNGRPVYYVLNGEWLQAIESGAGLSAFGDRWAGESLISDLLTNKIVSTS